MPRNNKTIISKSQQRALEKMRRDAEKQRNKDLKLQWQFLRKIGAYNTKETAAEMRLTNSRIKAIRKKMREINSLKKLVKGKTIRPVQLVSYVTPSGKSRLKYDVNNHFQFIRTKKKTKLESGVRKTKKGVIVEKSFFGKVSINNKGEIIERVGRVKRKRTRYKGNDLLKFVDDIQRGKIKLNKNEWIMLHSFGHPMHSIDYQTPDLFSQYIQHLHRTMSEKVYEHYIDSSYVEIQTIIDDAPEPAPSILVPSTKRKNRVKKGKGKI